jgi:hypothetical protein
MEPRHIPNNWDTLLTIQKDKLSLLTQSLENIVTKSPPLDVIPEVESGAAFCGQTGIAYLFLHLSVLHPDLLINSHSPIHWAKAYISGDRGNPKLEDESCGLGSEKLCYAAIRAAVMKDLGNVKDLVSIIQELLPAPTGPGEKDRFESEMLYGRAGALYLLRLVRHWVPESAALVEEAIEKLSERILNTDDDGKGNWIWYHRRYIGPPHGDIGIIAQLVLTTPALAPRLASKVEHLLSLQEPNGNFPKFDEPYDPEKGAEPELVQWCHGAPGFVLALQALRPYFSPLQDRLDNAIAKAQACTWKLGLLRKEPNLCHGLWGNAL